MGRIFCGSSSFQPGTRAAPPNPSDPASKPEVVRLTKRSADSMVRFISVRLQRPSLLPRIFQLLDAVDYIAVIRVDTVDLHEGLLCGLRVADLDMRGRQIVEKTDVLVFGDLRYFQSLAIPLDGELRHSLLEKAKPEHGSAFHGALGVFGGQLELADGLVDETHLLVGDTEVVVGVVVLAVELLFDAFFELFEDLFEGLFFFRKGDRILSTLE